MICHDHFPAEQISRHYYLKMSNLEEIRQQYRINFVRPSIPIENDVLGSIHTTPESGNGYASWAVHSRGIGMSIMKKVLRSN